MSLPPWILEMVPSALPFPSHRGGTHSGLFIGLFGLGETQLSDTIRTPSRAIPKGPGLLESLTKAKWGGQEPLMTRVHHLKMPPLLEKQQGLNQPVRGPSSPKSDGCRETPQLAEATWVERP